MPRLPPARFGAASLSESSCPGEDDADAGLFFFFRRGGGDSASEVSTLLLDIDFEVPLRG